MTEPCKELVPGQLYEIELDDCCISGKITGRFLRWEFGEDDEEQDYEYADAIFDIGRIGPVWGAWYPKPITEER